jgi:ubiquinone/menaquinone biosynthesis C-methylase UbiE
VKVVPFVSDENGCAVSGWTTKEVLSISRAVLRFLTSYPAKRFLGLLFSNSQTLRWTTQGRILRRAADEFRRPGIRALDVGSGGGGYAIENHLRRGTPAMLCDYSTDLLELARQQVASVGMSHLAEFTQCSAEALPFADSAYDFIQCMEVLEHLHHPEKALAEFRRVARPGARLVVSVPHPPEWFTNPEHVVEGYRMEEIGRLVEAAGWRVIRSEYCMLILTRLSFALLQKIRIPLPLNPLVAFENLIPKRWRHRFLPYDVVVVAEAKP